MQPYLNPTRSNIKFGKNILIQDDKPEDISIGNILEAKYLYLKIFKIYIFFENPNLWGLWKSEVQTGVWVFFHPAYIEFYQTRF